MAEDNKAEPLTEQEYEQLQLLLKKRKEWLDHAAPIGVAIHTSMEVKNIKHEREMLYQSTQPK